ncbi:MAG TPA: hypothetical protein VF263_25485 [Longimicrobiaceae bacterium]
MRRTLIAALAVGSLLAGASGLEAQSIPSHIRYIEPKQSLGLFGGYLWTQPSIEINDAEIALGPKSAPLVGAQYNLRFAGPLSGEVRLAFAPTERTLYGPVTENDPREFVPVEAGTADVALLVAEAGLTFHVTGQRTWHGIAPFVAGTGGLVMDLNAGTSADDAIPEAARYDFGPAFALGLGIGTDWFPTERLSVRVEGRNRLWQVEAPAGLRPSNLRELSEWTHNFSLSIGAALHF